MLRELKSFRGSFLTIVFASLFLVSFGTILHNAFADQLVATIGVTQAPYRVLVSPDSDVVFQAQVNCFNLLLANGEFAQHWAECMHAP
ncbi:MAG: hypothetical protein ACREBI_10905 [Nitrosotalea sp.]